MLAESGEKNALESAEKKPQQGPTELTKKTRETEVHRHSQRLSAWSKRAFEISF